MKGKGVEDIIIRWYNAAVAVFTYLPLHAYIDAPLTAISVPTHTDD